MSAALWQQRPFQVGLLLKLIAIAGLVPLTQVQWFVPFVQQTVWHPSLDPWQTFLTQGGNPHAFPYGIVMLIFHLPFVWAGTLFDAALGNAFYGAKVGFGASLLIADIGLLIALIRLQPASQRAVIWAYWLNPIVLFVTYWHGQTDVIPIMLIAYSLVAIEQGKLQRAGALLALSVAAKLSCLILLPFIGLFLYKNPRYNPHLWSFWAAVLGVLLCTQGVFFLSPGVQVMMLGNPEMSKIFAWTLPLPGGAPIYILPVLYLLLLYTAWQMGRMSLPMLQAFLGMAFLLIILFTQAPVGWYLWIVPFLVLYQTHADSVKQAVILGFYTLFLMYYSLQATGAYSVFGALPATAVPLEGVEILLSGVVAFGIVLGINMLQNALKTQPKWRYPLSIGIAGDSSTGKDTLSLALAQLFGEHQVASLSGDDYHRFERQHGAWQRITHLNPKANALHQFADHALKLIQGKPIYCRHYSHDTGRFHMACEVKAKDIVLISGLHVLLPDHLREKLDVKIFLSMDERLRRHFKMQRDVHKRGHSPERVLQAMDSRQADAQAYIAPQAAWADLTFSLSIPSNTPLPPKAVAHLPLLLTVKVPPSFPIESFVRIAVSLGGILVQPLSHHRFSLETQQVKGADIQAMAKALCADRQELIALSPRWEDGALGLMQLIVFLQLVEEERYAH